MHEFLRVYRLLRPTQVKHGVLLPFVQRLAAALLRDERADIVGAPFLEPEERLLSRIIAMAEVVLELMKQLMRRRAHAAAPILHDPRGAIERCLSLFAASPAA